MILFDIARGLIITMAFSILYGWEPSLQLLVTGVVASILPDFDLLIYVACRGTMGKWAHKHRDISHYPLIVLPMCIAAFWYFFGIRHSIFIATCVLGNYVFDSGDIGWGIRWLWPIPYIGNRYFAYKSIGGESAKFHFWTYEEQRAIADQHGKETWVSDSSMWQRDGIFLASAFYLTMFWYLAYQ